MLYVPNIKCIENNENFINKEFLLEIFLYLENNKKNNSKYFFNEFLKKQGFNPFSALKTLIDLNHNFLNDSQLGKLEPYLKKHLNTNIFDLRELFLNKFKETQNLINVYYQINFDNFLKIENQKYILNNTNDTDDFFILTNNKLILEENHSVCNEFNEEEFYFLGNFIYNNFLFFQINKLDRNFYYKNFYKNVDFKIFKGKIKQNNQNDLYMNLLPYIQHPKYKECYIFFSDEEMKQRIKYINSIITKKLINDEKKSF